MTEINTSEPMPYTVLPGDPLVPGIHRVPGGIAFTCVDPRNNAELLLYAEGEDVPFLTIPMRNGKRIGDCSSVIVDLPEKSFTYTYRFGNEEKPDPYAQEIVRIPAGKKPVLRGGIRPFAEAKTKPTGMPISDMILYKLHVRGMTMKRKGTKAPGTFAGLIEQIPYLTSLGINAVLLMPVYTGSHSETNYWGYEEGFYFAPQARYAASSDPNQEFADLVDAFHEAGIACLTEFFFREDADARFVTDVLRHWMIRFHLDGFRLAGVGRWLAAVEEDPLLAESILLLPEAVEGSMPPIPGKRRKAVYRTEFRDIMRRFLKGDTDVSLESVADMQRQNGVSLSYVHFLADQDGFTLADLMMYEERHNEANGQENRDGTIANYSWNCGVEGPTRKPSVAALRKKQMRNAILLMLTAQGIPLLYAGDEAGNTQQGNNNAWCQDNPTGWVTWKSTKEILAWTEFVRRAIAFRKAHPVLKRDEPLRLLDYKETGLPDLSYHCSAAWMRENSKTRVALGVLYSGAYASHADGKSDDTLYLLYNMYWHEQSFALPDAPAGKNWVVLADTAAEEVFYPEKKTPKAVRKGQKEISLAPRSIRILAAR